MLKAICHVEGSGWTDVHDVARISNLIQQEGNVVWAEVDVATLTPKDTATISDEFGLHPLAVEDALSLRQRPKFEAYENHLFTVMHQLDEADGQFEARQIACFISKGWVLTIHEHAQRTLDEVGRRLRAQPKPRERGPSHIMHTLLDVIVDDYQHKAEEIEDEVEQLEELVLAHTETPVDKQLYSVKQRLARLRRYAVPGERILATMFAPSSTAVPDETSAYFRDVHDHMLRIIDQMRNVQDLADALIDLRRVEQANALNEVTKRLTGWAAIIAVPTLIASMYGMNFRLTPADQKWGFEIALGMMIATGLGLYTFFKRRGWI
jgi:magnesium transporter